MNIFKKMLCRSYQFCMWAIIPFLPYRRPKLLNDYKNLAQVVNNSQSILIVTDNTIIQLNLLKELTQSLEENKLNYVIFSDVVPNPTTQNVENGLKVYLQNNCDCIIALGGGSVMDCAKAIGARVTRPKKSLGQMKGILKIRKRLPTLIAIPTTAGTGSETTLASVITDSETRYKYAINDFALIPKYALLDAQITLGLPKFVTATTGMDALTHAVEAYIGKSTTCQTRKYSIKAIQLIFQNILEVYNNPSNLQARKNMLMASFFAGIAFTKSYVGYIHAIAHSLGGKYNISHGLANAVIMPYVLKSYGKKVYKKLWKLGISCNLFDKSVSKQDGANIFIQKIEDLNKKLQIPTNLQEIQKQDIKQLSLTAEKEANPLYPVPVLFDAKQLEKIYYMVGGINEDN